MSASPKHRAEYIVAQPGTLIERMKRDLGAWELAIAVIAKAKRS